MRLLFVSDDGAGLGMATHLSSEGHAITFYTNHGSMLGKGIIEIAHPESEVSIADIYCYDNTKYGKEADEIRNTGSRVLGASSWSSMLETDKEYQDQVIKLIGWEKAKSSAGINLYTTVWFNGDKYIATYNSLVYRRFMSGGAGPDLGCVGMMSNFNPPTDKVYTNFLKPLEKILKRVNHRGCVHIHSLIKDSGFGVSEISTQFAHPLSYLLFENSNVSVADILLRLFNENSQRIEPLEHWASGVMLSVPPYPYHIIHNPVEIKGVQPANLKHLWLCDAQKIGGSWYTAANDGKIGYVTARGVSPEESVRRMYRTIGNLEIKDGQYRNDVGKNINTVLETLKRGGWIR